MLIILSLAYAGSGSRKYPLKEPFVELLKSSLQTFLNAMTYPDRTVYPVASQNEKDFCNLDDVYLDAVFFPRLRPEVLAQEGWHYELDGGGGGEVASEAEGSSSSSLQRESLVKGALKRVPSKGAL